MKTNLLKIIVLAFLFSFVCFQNKAKACHLATVTIVGKSNLGGGVYEYTVEICTGTGGSAMGLLCATGATGNTQDFSISASGGTFTGINNSGFTPTVISAFNSVVSIGVVSGGVLTYTAPSPIYQIPATGDPCTLYGAITQWCWNVTFQTTGEPTDIIVNGIEGVETGQNSTPCILSTGNPSYTSAIAPPICLVTVDSAGLNNQIIWEKTPPSTIDSFIVYRYSPVALSYLRIGVVSNDSLSLFVDTARSVGGPNGGDPQYTSYQYELAARDTFGNMTTRSALHQPIFLSSPGGGSFSWTAYLGSAISGYQFMRDDNGTGVWNVLSNTTVTSASDPNYLSYPNAKYRVQAFTFDCTPTRNITATLSNIKNNNLTSGITELNNDDLEVFPNPTSGVISLSLKNNTSTKPINIRVYNILGKVVFENKIILNSKNNTNKIDLNNVGKGIYFLETTIENKMLRKKIVVE